MKQYLRVLFPPGMTGGTLCFRVVRLSAFPSFRPSHFRYTTLRAAPSKNYAFATNYHACIAMPTWRRCAPPITFWPWPPYNLLPRSCLTFLRRSSLMGTTLRATSSKSYVFSTNYHACIVLQTCRRCAPPINFWPWPPHNLLPRSCLTWIFFVDSHWWVQLYVQRPAKAIPFQHISMQSLQRQHDTATDGRLLFYFDLDLHITCSWGRV